MKLTIEEIDIITKCMETSSEVSYDDEAQDVLSKLYNKRDEIIGKKSRLLSDSELKSMGM